MYAFLFKCLLLSANVSCSSQMYVFVSNVYCFLEVCLACDKCIFYQMSVACWICVLLVTNVFFIKCLLLAGNVSCLLQMYVLCMKCLLQLFNSNSCNVEFRRGMTETKKTTSIPNQKSRLSKDAPKNT